MSFRNGWWDYCLTFTIKEYQLKYKSSVLSWIWVLLVPLFQVMVIAVIVGSIMPMQTIDYFFVLFPGLIAWNFFSQSVSRSFGVIAADRNIIHKAVFPREVLVISTVFSYLGQLFISLILFVGLQFLGNRFIFTDILFIFGGVILLVLFTIGICLVFSYLYTWKRDFSFIISMLLQVWFYLTPIIYLPEWLPLNLQRIIEINPMTGIIYFIRGSLIGLIPSILSTAFVFVVGWIVFKIFSKNFDDWV